MVRLSVRLTVSALLVAAADLLTYGRYRGCGITVLSLLVAAAAWARWGRELARSGPWLILWLAVAFGASVEGSRFSVLLLFALGWTVLGMAHLTARPPLFDGIVRGFAGGLRSLTAAPADARRAMLIGRRRAGPLYVGSYLIPAALVLLFSLLIIPANVVLARWVTDAAEWLRDSLGHLTTGRCVFWLIAGAAAYGVMRFRLGSRPRGTIWPREPLAPADSAIRNALKACLLTLVGLNALYLLANVTDLAYLWLSAELPEGVTHAEYAHQGSYRLIVAVVLAALTLTSFFPTRSAQMESGRARGLAYLFVVQNLIVLAGAARRLELYVEAFGLTRFRVAVVFWLALVAIGFILVAVRTAARRPVRFLFETNAVATVLLLAAVSLLNIDGFIARWNVDRYAEGVHERIDLRYLRLLGPGALPSVRRLESVAEARGDRGLSRGAAGAYREMLAREREALQAWPSWTWRRAVSVERSRNP